MTGTDQRPTVLIDIEKGYFEIKGISIPENPRELFFPITNLVDKYLVKPQPITNLIFKLEYFNTSTTKFMLNLINTLEILEDRGLKVNVEWHYRLGDDDMMEAADDFSELCNINIKVIPYD